MKEKTQEPDLIDRIADALPSDDVRAAYYREMRHLRSLPESDELLRILRAMMFLTVLTEQVPARVLTEREKLEQACSDLKSTAIRMEFAGSNYYNDLDQRMIKLPGEVLKGISPKAIVEIINENLKQQFTASTIPIVAQELAVNANTIKTATKEYTQATKELSGSWRTVADEAQKTIEKIQGAVSGAAKASQKAAVDFSNTFSKTYDKALYFLCSLALVAGILIGILIIDQLRPLTKTVYEIPPNVQSIIDEQRERELMFTPKEK